MKSLQGHFLIAGNELVDPNFFRSVVLIVQHNDEGAMGLIVNRPMETTVQEAWEQVFHASCEMEGVLHQGGPCEGPLMVVHNDADASQVQVLPGVYLSTDKDQIQGLVEGNAQPAKFFVGYAGWSAGQLESELASDSWLVAPATPQLIFAADGRLWDDLTKRLGRAALYHAMNIRHVPDDPSVN